MSNDPRIHRHTFVNGRCEVCSLDAEDLRPHEHVFDVNWNCTICRLSYKNIYGKEPWKPDIDAIAREAALELGADAPLATVWQETIAAAIRRAQGETYPNLFQELSRQITERKSERDGLEQENKDMAKAMALKLKLEHHLSEALSERDAAVNRIFDLKRTNQMLAEQLFKHAEAIAERDALVNVVKAADELETLLRKNTGKTDDWPIEIKVSGDYAKRLTEKLNALSSALKPYREKMK